MLALTADAFRVEAGVVAPVASKRRRPMVREVPIPVAAPPPESKELRLQEAGNPLQPVRRAAAGDGGAFRRFRFHDLRTGRGGIDRLQQAFGHRSIKATDAYLAFLTAEEAAQKTAQANRFDPAEVI